MKDKRKILPKSVHYRVHPNKPRCECVSLALVFVLYANKNDNFHHYEIRVKTRTEKENVLTHIVDKITCLV